MYYNGTDWIRLAKGTAGQLLQMNTGATAPEWKTGTSTTIVNDLTTGGTTEALSAEQGKVLEDSKAAKNNVLELDNAVAFDPTADYEPATKKYVDDNSTTIINDLTTGGTTEALSANQGKVLEDSKAAKNNVLELDNAVAFDPTADYEPATKKYVDDNGYNYS